MNYQSQIDEKIGKGFKEASLLVKSSFPSVYTKDDVIEVLFKFHNECITLVGEVLSSVDLNVKPEMSRERVEDLQEALRSSIESKLNRMNGDDVVDYDSVDLSIGYQNQVEIDSIDVNTDYILDQMDDAISDSLEEFFAISEETVNPE